MNVKNVYIKEEELNLIKSKDKFGNIKSKYILQKIFDFLLKKKLLEIIKYNKNIQKRMDIDNTKDYKEYSESYSSIEIEIIPAENKYGKFINIDKTEDEEYYHIYFDNNYKEVIKRYNLNENEKIKTIQIIIDYQVKSFNRLFYFCTCVESISFKNFLEMI